MLMVVVVWWWWWWWSVEMAVTFCNLSQFHVFIYRLSRISLGHVDISSYAIMTCPYAMT
jgi:hypothetical protein